MGKCACALRCGLAKIMNKDYGEVNRKTSTDFSTVLIKPG